MTNKRNNWERLMMAIEWLNMTPNSFAMHIGMTRAESLYHIQRGNFGISPDLADRITRYFPEINRTWLLTGAGNMLDNKHNTSHSIPFYDGDIETILQANAEHQPSGYIRGPYANMCDIAVHSTSKAMLGPSGCVATLFIKLCDPAQLKVGSEYILQLPSRVVWRKISLLEEYDITLTAHDSINYEDIKINVSDILLSWEVIAKSTSQHNGYLHDIRNT